MKVLDDLARIPPESYARRALYCLLIAAGVTMTAFGSILVARLGPIPFRFIPDVRFVVFGLSGLMFGLYAAGGGAHRRSLALWGVLGYVVAFHLEEALVHWIPLPPGSITGTPVGILGTAGSLVAIVGVLLMHGEVESVKLAEDLASRGAREEDARLVATRLRDQGARRILAIAAGAAGLGALVLAAAPVFGSESVGGEWVLLLGAGLLLALAWALGRWVPRARAG